MHKKKKSMYQEWSSLSRGIMSPSNNYQLLPLHRIQVIMSRSWILFLQLLFCEERYVFKYHLNHCHTTAGEQNWAVVTHVPQHALRITPRNHFLHRECLCLEYRRDVMTVVFTDDWVDWGRFSGKHPQETCLERCGAGQTPTQSWNSRTIWAKLVCSCWFSTRCC